MPNVDRIALDKACFDMGDAVMNPNAWPRIMEGICEAAKATGAMLLQSDVRTPDIPYTPAIQGLVETYFQEGWHLRDSRAARAVPLLFSGTNICRL
jgi:hypothetical protein